jgi:hypothetical protein
MEDLQFEKVNSQLFGISEEYEIESNQDFLRAHPKMTHR